MGISNTAQIEVSDDIQDNVDFSYLGWTPAIQVWLAGEGQERNLPYIIIDFIATQDKRFASFADVVGRVDDRRYEHAYCETELVNITIYTKKYHNSGVIRGRDYAEIVLKRIRTRIFAFWSDTILYKYNASVDRGAPAPIRNLTLFDTETQTRIHEFELDVFLRTDVRWYKELSPEQVYLDRTEKAYLIMNNKNNIRINTS